VTVFVDDPKVHPGGKQWCHLLGTNEKELDYFAICKLGLKAEYKQTRAAGHRYTHYDLTPAKRRSALRKGARYMPTRELLARVGRAGDS
jgi:hypothetical protein